MFKLLFKAVGEVQSVVSLTVNKGGRAEGPDGGEGEEVLVLLGRTVWGEVGRDEEELQEDTELLDE